ncbi:MAG: WYL domain-containing protein [Mogibacterium sp.]|nr:WYL domain-containing protein [Mogibacterium sp.]
MNDNRRKLTGILKLLYENTDAEHSMDTYQIMDALESMGYTRPDRKTIDANIKFLIQDLKFGILKEKGKPNRYKWVNREFDIAELKMLADAVHSSRFISHRKSREIITKLKDLTSVHQASSLNREMYTRYNFKHDSSEALKTADIINDAIKKRLRVRFQLTCYNMNKDEVLQDDGKVYEVSPYALIWHNENYYMLGSVVGSSDIKFFRVDHMKAAEQTHTESAPAPSGFDLNNHSTYIFDMSEFKTQEVILSCKAHTMGDLIDRFGRDFHTEQVSEDRFNAKVEVDCSKAFFAWVFGFNGDVRIEEPADVRRDYEEMLRRQLRGE